ncbi:MAG: PD-(D/E)XK nuclease family protein [Rhodothermaceae bacterium]
MILTKQNVKNIDLDHIINSKIKDDKLNTLLIVVPTNRKARHLKKELIDLSNNNTVSQLNIETIGTLSELLLHSVKKFNSLSEAAASVFIERSVNKNELKYFSSYKDEIPAGTLDKIKNVISEYKKQGITPGILREEAEKLESSEKLKALDIAGIYEKFSEKCAQINAFQTGDVYSNLLNEEQETISKVFRQAFPDVDLIVINGFAEFTTPEVSIINRLNDINASELFVNFDYYNYNPQVFSYLDKCYEKFLLAGFNKITDDNEHNARRFIKSLRESIFRETETKHTNFKDVITKLNASDRIQEVELIAKEIKHLVIEEKVEPSKICVAFNLVSNYSELFRDIFASYKIPVNLTDRIALDNSPVVVSIISFLEIIENDYYYKNLHRALSSGFISLKKIDTNSLLGASSALKIISGKANWKLNLEEAIENCGEENGKQKIMFEKALAGIEEIEKHLKVFSGEMKIADFYKELMKLVLNLDVVNKVLEISNGKEEENIKALTTFVETAEEICELLKLEYGNDEKFSLSYYIKHIKIAASRARFNVKEKSDYGVLITSVNEIRGLEFDYLFLGGLTDGDFPTKYSPEIFFSGSFCKKEQQHQTEERYHFYQTLCCWKKKLFLSTSQAENGKELEESVFLKEFLKLFEVSEKKETEYKDRIYTDEEILITAGKDFSRDLFSKELQKIIDIEIEALQAAVKINLSRKLSDGEFSEYNGFVNIEDQQIEEQMQKLKEREYSVSQLEVYAKCPFKFFMERILRIETLEEPSEEIEAVEIGNILHQIMYEFYTALKEKNIVLQNCDGETFLNCKEILFEISDKHLSNISFKLPLSFIEKEKIFGTNERRESSLLYKFLEYERKQENSALPKYFEVAFGSVDKENTDKDLSINEPVEIGDIKIRGKIDRVEVDEENKTFSIVDYKTGSAKPAGAELKRGLSLQLPVYLHAVEKLLREKYGEDFTGTEMLIYTLKYDHEKFGKHEVKYDRKKSTPDELREHINNSLDMLSEYVREIISGKFNLSEMEDREAKICRFCDFKSVCRISSK